jgi:hypothetical protein
MKKLLILFLFIPLLASGQTAIKVNQKGTAIYQEGNAINTSPGYYTPYNTHAQLLFNRMDIQPTNARKVYYDELFDSLDFYKLYDSLDVYVITAAHDTFASLLNLKGDYSNATPVNKPTFTVDRGWAGNGTTSFINTNYSASLNGVNYKPHSASFGAYVRNNVASSDGMSAIGCYNSSTPVIYNLLYPKSSGITLVRINSTGSGQPSIASDSTQGFFQVHKVLTTLYISRKNSFSTNAGYATQTTLPVPCFFIDAGSTGGTITNYGTYQIAAYYFGGSMSVLQRSKLYEITERFLDHIGAGVL